MRKIITILLIVPTVALAACQPPPDQLAGSVFPQPAPVSAPTTAAPVEPSDTMAPVSAPNSAAPPTTAAPAGEASGETPQPEAGSAIEIDPDALAGTLAELDALMQEIANELAGVSAALDEGE